MTAAGRIPDRDEAFAILTEFTQNESLIKHALAVEAAMRHYARLYDEDEAYWGVVGLLHDFDYERYPTLEDHPFRGGEILRERGYDAAMIRSMMSHGGHTGIARESRLERTLFAVDELCGLVTAVALVKPSKKLDDVEVKSVKKKLKDKAFARSVNRDDIRNGAVELGVDLDAHIDNVIQAMRSVSGDLGL